MSWVSGSIVDMLKRIFAPLALVSILSIGCGGPAADKKGDGDKAPEAAAPAEAPKGDDADKKPADDADKKPADDAQKK